MSNKQNTNNKNVIYIIENNNILLIFRYKLAIIVVIINNSGIYSGLDQDIYRYKQVVEVVIETYQHNLLLATLQFKTFACLFICPLETLWGKHKFIS